MTKTATILSRLTLLLCLLLPISGLAETLYCGPSSTGAGSGANFSNLLALPNTTGFSRGNTYVVVDGSYGSKVLSTASSGSTVITIRKANSAQDSGVTGYAASLHDGIASFGSISVATPYWIVDGITRTEQTGWGAPAGYGMSATQIRASLWDSPAANASYSQFRYIDIGRTYSTSYSSGMTEAVYITYQNNLTFHRCAMHNSTHALLQGAGSRYITVEYCDIGPGWGKEAIRGGNGGISDGWTIRYNKFWNSTQVDPNDGTSGITAEIGMWSWSGTATAPTAIYGNWFYNQYIGGRNACIVIGGNGSSWVGGGANGTIVYNNTFVGFPEQSASGVIALNGSSTVARNNLAYNINGTLSVIATTTSSNTEVTSNPFVNSASYNFRLSAATAAGYTLSIPYNTDMDGKIRGANGTWAIGAYESDSGGATAPAAPQTPVGLRTVP